MADAQKNFNIIDNPAISELYANKLIGTSFDGGAVSITLGATRFVPQKGGESPKKDQPASVHVTARLALSPGGAVELANALGAMLKTLSQMQQKAAQVQEKEEAKPN
jgi:hypothetical protein